MVQSGVVFHLPDPRPLHAPYPSLTFLPAEPIIADVPYVLVHGLIDEAGMMQNLKVVGPIQSWTSALLTALTQWKFRPAARAETPEPVEIVLAIPGRKK